MEKMNATRSQSTEVLDSSSASSLSIFADQADRNLQLKDHLVESGKPREYSPRASVDEALKSEAAFIQFLTSIPPPKEPSEHHQSADSMITRNRSPAGGQAVSKVGLDHLDNLCKLMEQLGELRDNNSKLQKRVQYLEDLKSLHDMHKEICEGSECSPAVANTFKPGPYQLKKSATEVHCPKKEEVQPFSKSPSRYRRGRILQQATGPRRGRSKSVGHEELNDDPKSRRLFPKWSKVKEAFGWESERKDSIKMKGEGSNILNSRRRSDESRQTFRYSRNSTQWYPDSPINSSVEEVSPEDVWKGDAVQMTEQLDVPHDSLRRQKSTPSPASDKSLVFQDLKTKSYTIDRDTYRNQDFKDESKRGKSPWGRVKTIIERHRDSLKRRSLRQDSTVDDINIKCSVDQIEFKLYDDYFEDAVTVKQSSSKEIAGKKQSSPIVLDKEGECAVGQRITLDCQRIAHLSPTLQRKSRWNKMTKALKGKKDEEKDPMSLSTPTSPHSQQDGHFTFDVIEETSQNSLEDTNRDISRIASDSHVNQLALSVQSSDIMLQLQRNLSEDFHRKIQEWDRIRATSSITTSSPPPQWDRKPSDTSHNRKKTYRDEKTVKNKIKDLTWLEKELQKIEKEKHRLSKERQKYEERGNRLQKLKETFLCESNSGKREVLVRTSAGEFRFEGISDAFTKKLYEWETKRGLGPELSTIALLDSSRLTVQPSLGSKPGPMQRVLSRSESSVLDIGLPSHTSSNSLPSVKLPDSSESDKLNQPSRANSEPDLTTLAAFGNENNSSTSRMVTTQSMTDVSDLDVASRGMSKESEEEDFDKPRKGSETYYGLLEENVILLEQLKVKEEICRRLEKDLEILDEKMDEMSTRHVQETQRYREKLWEMHQQGASPRDVQCCRRTMEQLRQRIEALEKWTQKLRNDRETVEVNFRYHSKEQENMTLDLLGKMRELQAAETSNPDISMGLTPRMDVTTLERLQDLSALLTKQTQDLEETLSEKSRQICQLKWELLHRDLSCVKLETEQHAHSPAHKKRTKYAHWRSRSSEEASTGTQKVDPSNYVILATEAYCAPSSLDKYKATNLANTVQELNKEVLKLTSDSSVSSLIKCGQDEKEYTNEKSQVVPKTHCKGLLSKVSNLKKITVRRSSADNLSLVSTDDNRLKEGNSSTTLSEDSTDDYYSRIYGSEVKTNFPTTMENERLLMSYGENLPRSHGQRKKKFQKASKLNSAFLRKRSNTFHTNRDLQKPNINENVPQKCQSFRVARENYLEDCVIDKSSHSRRKFQNSHFNIQNNDCQNSRCREFQDDASLSNWRGEVGTLDNYSIKCFRQVASDSKLPAIMRAQNFGESPGNDKLSRKSPLRSMSEKMRKETANERRDQLQKKRMKRRLKSLEKPPEFQSSTSVSSVATLLEHVAPSDKTATGLISKENFNKSSQSKLPKANPEVPTITIQLPKRKHRRSSYKVEELPPAEEQSFVIVMPKKRSLSSECDSSISENSPREVSVSPHSYVTDKSSNYPPDKNSFTNRSGTTSLSTSETHEKDANGNIRLMKLVSLETFDTPFYSNNHHTEKKHKAEENPGKEQTLSPMSYTTRLPSTSQRATINTPIPSHGSTGEKQQEHLVESDLQLRYIKSPSAPHLDWKKKVYSHQRVSKASAPNVRSLIERYNQKVIESNIFKSPSVSSNVSSPATLRKISTPTGTCSIRDYVPQFCSTPSTPTCTVTPFNLSNSSFPQSSPPSPMLAARAEALKRAKETFITSQISTPNSPLMLRTIYSSKTSSRAKLENPNKDIELQTKTTKELRPEEDRMSCSSMDSMNLVMLRAGENCREKRTSDFQRNTVDKHNLKTSKSLSNSSLFKTVLSSDFKMPTSLLKLKRSKRKKDMSAVTELCRQSLLLATDDAKHIPTPVSPKSCPASPELKAKSAAKSNWLQRNIFRQK